MAAGSADTGIWFLFPDSPVGPSADKNFFEHKEAKRTPITSFVSNVAHSNQKIGLRNDKRLGTDHQVIGCSTYDPRDDPLNRRSNRTPVFFYDFTGESVRRILIRKI